MMKVAIFTLGLNYLLTNYGTFLQHYCLRRVLKKNGYDSIRLPHEKNVDQYHCPAIAFLLVVMRYVIRVIKRKRNNFMWLTAALAQVRMTHQFGVAYRSLVGDLFEPLPEVAIGLMGSDQVLDCGSNAWFKTLSGKGGRLIYAGSADWKHLSLDEKKEEKLRCELPKFCAVSVRECAGLEICQKYVKVGVAVKKVLDPVLLSDWRDLTLVATEKTVFQMPTLFCYFVNVTEASQLQLAELERIAAKLGCQLKILGIQGTMQYVPLKYRLVLSPQSFLAAFRDAAYVVTNSFHGGVVAFRYKKQFVIVRQFDKPGRDQNLRQIEFLRMFGLSHLFCDEVRESERVLVKEVDYAPLYRMLSRLQKDSLVWLLDSLKKAACERCEENTR